MNMISQIELKKVLSKLIRHGDEILCHASINAIGKIDGGPDALRDVILECLGSEGTFVMPASTRNEFVETGVFDLKNSKGDVGALSESLRKHPDAIRSANPMTSYVAVGKNASEYTRIFNSYLEDDSPMMKLRRRGGKLLLYGIGYAKCTMYHLSEERLKMDYNFYKTFKGTLVDFDGSRKPVEQQFFVRKSMDTKKDASYAGSLFEKSGSPLWKETLGQGIIRSFYAADFDNFCTEELKKNPLLFLKEQS